MKPPFWYYATMPRAFLVYGLMWMVMPNRANDFGVWVWDEDGFSAFKRLDD